MSPRADHNAAILDQFTKQVDSYTARHRDHQTAFRLAIETSGVGAQDDVLDVACGPGLLACAVAGVARRVTGVDLTPAMLDKARALQAEKGVSNVDWRLADARSLPFADGAFSLVMSRYAFHHFLEPPSVLAEMLRVCRPGGKLMVIDTVPPAAKADAYNRAERLRDPSHVRALPPEEFTGLLREAGLTELRTAAYWWEVVVEDFVQAAFIPAEAKQALHKTYLDDQGKDLLGMNVHERDGVRYLGLPTLIVVGHKRTQ